MSFEAPRTSSIVQTMFGVSVELSGINQDLQKSKTTPNSLSTLYKRCEALRETIANSVVPEKIENAEMLTKQREVLLSKIDIQMKTIQKLLGNLPSQASNAVMGKLTGDRHELLDIKKRFSELATKDKARELRPNELTNMRIWMQLECVDLFKELAALPISRELKNADMLTLQRDALLKDIQTQWEQMGEYEYQKEICQRRYNTLLSLGFSPFDIVADLQRQGIKASESRLSLNEVPPSVINALQERGVDLSDENYRDHYFDGKAPEYTRWPLRNMREAHVRFAQFSSAVSIKDLEIPDDFHLPLPPPPPKEDGKGVQVESPAVSQKKSEQIVLLQQALDELRAGRQEKAQEYVRVLNESFPEAARPIFATVYTEAQKKGKQYAAQLAHPKFGRAAFFGKDKCDVSLDIRITAIEAALKTSSLSP